MLWWDWDSMCSMPTTFAVSERSKFVTIRLSISSGLNPLYCQTTLTIGMSMYGKMSTGMVAIDRPPRMAISRAMTTNVYGRRSASRTIHIGFTPGYDGADLSVYAKATAGLTDVVRAVACARRGIS